MTSNQMDGKNNVDAMMVNYDSQRLHPMRQYEPSNRKYRLGDRLCSIQLPSHYPQNATKQYSNQIKLNQESWINFNDKNHG